VRAELGPRTPELLSVGPWGENAEFVAAHAARIAAVLGELPGTKSELILTAHSLPMRAIRAGDAYATQVDACARALGAKLGRSFQLAYQSQGADGGEWLGPDLRSALQACRDAGKSEVVVAPFGFLADHIETLYDLDVEAKAWAAELGLRLQRIPALNSDERFIGALAQIAEGAFANPSRRELR
jgi:protoporphyrin/coproporphyrin ferrochelatase